MEEGKKFSLAKILKHGADPNAMTLEDPGQKRTLLCISIEEAVQIDDLSKVELLLEAKADPNKKSETGSFPLQLAIKANHLHLARQLLQHKADPDLQDEKLVSPLHTAVFQDNPKICQLLTMRKANLNIADRLGQTPMFFASSTQVCSLLLEAKSDLLHLNHKGQSALHLAANCGNCDALDWIMEKMPSLIDLQDENGRTPMHHAAARGHQAAVRLLLDSGADFNIKTNNGHTAMSIADAKHPDTAYYIFCRMTGSNKSSFREMTQNPMALFTVAILGVAALVHRKLLWDFTWDMYDLLTGA